MKAIVCMRYGGPDVLRLREVEKPAPEEDEVLLRVRAASINSRDWRMMRANPFFIRFLGGGWFKPKVPILGADAAGVVESVGGAVTQFRPGDEVFGCLHRRSGRTFAEYVCAAEDELAPKPQNLTFEQAAAAPLAALTALQGLRDRGGIRAGMRVAVQGSSGGVGTFAVQWAKLFGAEVTAVCRGKNADLMRTLGADRVVDYTEADFTRSGESYDLILAVNGYHPIGDYLRALAPDGAYVVAGGSMRQFLEAAAQSRRGAPSGGRRIAVVSLVECREDLLFLRREMEAGRIAPVIDGRYPLARAADAFRYFEKVHPRGKVVLTID
jgi:NADPH:quinone reductase-like Zn-dependent oxidoreductase